MVVDAGLYQGNFKKDFLIYTVPDVKAKFSIKYSS